MNISDLLAPEAVLASLKAQTKKQLLQELAARAHVRVHLPEKQIFETLFLQKGTSFQKVCLVEWPRHGIWTLAFISREIDGAMIGLEKGRKMYAAYVSTTPNPTGGYVFFCDVGDVVVLNTTVEDALKLVISMGLVFPDGPLASETEMKLAGKPPRKKLTRRKVI